MSCSLIPVLRSASRMIVNCLRHSCIIAKAARPTACIVIAQNRNTAITPRNSPHTTCGFINVTL